MTDRRFLGHLTIDDLEKCRSCHFKKRFDGRALSIANPGPPRSADRDENAPAIACGRSRAVAPRLGPAPIRAGRRHIRLNPGERQWRDERVNRCEDCACLPPIEVCPGLRSAGVCVCRSRDRCSIPRSAFVPTCGQTVEAEKVCSSPILAFPRTPPDVRPLHDKCSACTTSQTNQERGRPGGEVTSRDRHFKSVACRFMILEVSIATEHVW